MKSSGFQTVYLLVTAASACGGVDGLLIISRAPMWSRWLPPLLFAAFIAALVAQWISRAPERAPERGDADGPY